MSVKDTTMMDSTEAQPKSLQGGLKGFFAGAFSVVWGLKKIFQDAELKKLAVIPLILTAIFYTGVAILTLMFADDLLAWIWKRPESGFLLWIWYILIPLIVFSMFVGLALLFTTVAEAVGGPFYDKMAMRILKDHSIRAREPGWIEGTIPDVFRSLIFVFVAAFFSLLGLIPVVGVPFALLAGLVAWLGLASSAINSALMVTGLGLSDRVAYVFRSFMAMAGIGAVMGLSLMVPFLGLISIPSAVVGATELYAQSRRR